MPNDPTAEQVEIRRKGRQRLIGAVALALAAVVFVPMVLDPEPRRERVEPILAIPPKDGAPPLATVTKAPEPAPAQAAPAAPSTPLPAEPPAPEPAAAVQPPSKSEASTPSPAPARKTVGPRSAEFSSAAAPKSPAPKAAPPEPKPAAAEPRPAPAAPRLEGFAVQVGAFREEAKLSQAREKLVAARVPHYTERLDAAGGPLTRLRAGPFPTREAAEKAAVTMRKAGLEGRVVPLP
jgi:DedD protein